MFSLRQTANLCIVCSVALAGCSSHAGNGTLVGGLLGTGVGTVIGGALGHPKTGAVAGALIGGGIGNAVGSDMDRAERHAEIRAAETRGAAAAAAYAAPLPAAVTPQEIVQMSRSGVPESTIIAHLRSTNAVYRLSAEEIAWLSQQGVPQGVIQYMIGTVNRPTVIGPPPVVYERPVVIERPVYVAEPPIRVGFHYHWGPGGWCRPHRWCR